MHINGFKDGRLYQQTNSHKSNKKGPLALKYTNCKSLFFFSMQNMYHSLLPVFLYFFAGFYFLYHLFCQEPPLFLWYCVAKHKKAISFHAWIFAESLFSAVWNGLLQKHVRSECLMWIMSRPMKATDVLYRKSSGYDVKEGMIHIIRYECWLIITMSHSHMGEIVPIKV